MKRNVVSSIRFTVHGGVTKFEARAAALRMMKYFQLESGDIDILFNGTIITNE